MELFTNIGKDSLKQIVARKEATRLRNQATIQAIIDGAVGEKEDAWNAILDLKFEELLAKLRAGDVTSVDALHAFQYKALQVNPDLNCVVNFLEDAERWARARDLLPEAERGPLHGLPISVKECYFVKNCDSTAGLTFNAEKPCTKDAEAVREMVALGAVPFCQTNVPQTMCTIQCSNPLYGETGNPWDKGRECGGSSGGEGCLIGAGGSVLGLGSDYGGSVRSPAALCGICSLRPTSGRHLSQLGVREPTSVGPVWPRVVGGFMSAEVNALITAYRIYWNKGHSDATIAPQKFDEDKFNKKRKLKIGVYTEDGVFEAHPGCVRAVRETADLLKKDGHDVVEFHPPPMEDVQRLYLGFTMADWGYELKKACSMDLYDSSTLLLRTASLIFSLPRITQYFIKWIISLLSKTMMPEPIATGYGNMAAYKETMELIQRYHEDMDTLGLDAILTFASYHPAPLKGTQGETCPIQAYLAWNLCDMPAGIVPVSKVSDADDRELDSLPKNDLFYTRMKQSTKGAIGLPLAVQVVGRRFDEETVLRVMKEVEGLVKYERK